MHTKRQSIYYTLNRLISYEHQVSKEWADTHAFLSTDEYMEQINDMQRSELKQLHYNLDQTFIKINERIFNLILEWEINFPKEKPLIIFH